MLLQDDIFCCVSQLLGVEGIGPIPLPIAEAIAPTPISDELMAVISHLNLGLLQEVLHHCISYLTSRGDMYLVDFLLTHFIHCL